MDAYCKFTISIKGLHFGTQNLLFALRLASLYWLADSFQPENAYNKIPVLNSFKVVSYRDIPSENSTKTRCANSVHNHTARNQTYSDQRYPVIKKNIQPRISSKTSVMFDSCILKLNTHSKNALS